MVKRNLEKTVGLNMVESVNGQRYPMELEYYLLESTSQADEETSSCSIYGIEIIKKISSHEVEKKAVNDIFSCKESTKHILNKLADNFVTPVSMLFVLDDIVGVY